MLSSPLVSVIMPAYNVQQYISESIESVLAQTYQNWELIVMDDGSTDGTAETVKKYLQDKRIKYFYQENAKQSEARNNAIAKSNGEFIAFLDSDDLWLSEKLEISVREIQSGAYDLLFTDTYYFDDDSEYPFASLKLGGVVENIYEGREGILTFLECNRIPNLTVVVKKETLLKAGDFIKIAAAEEYDMWLRLLYNGAVFKAIAAPLSSYRMRANSITANDRLATFETMIIIKRFATQHVEYRQEISKILKTRFVNWLYTGHKVTDRNYRAIILAIYPYVITLPLYLLSHILPPNLLRKVTNRSMN